MQKLQGKLKNTPTNTSLVCSTVNPLLNKDQSLSALDKVRTCNNPEVNHQQHRADQNLRVSDIVYVLNMRGNPLMPCKQQKARKLLKEGKAKVVKRIPFTIQLVVQTGENKQEIKLGIDTGYGFIGFSAITKKHELISGTLKLDGRTKKRLDENRMYRKIKRNKFWYRKSRFMNRKIKDDWLPPSIQRRYDTHINLINRIKELLPISQVIIEVAKFDIQKIENPEIQGKDYQQGNLYDYQNMRSYLLARENGKCQYCHKDFKGQSIHIHHIKPRSEGGNDRPNNLAILHLKCHDEIHSKHLEYKLKSNSKGYKQSTFMSIINRRFYNDVSNLKITYGNITYVNRNKLGLEKSHINDAFVIAGGENQERIKFFNIIQRHRNNRVLQLNRKGFKPSIKRSKSKIAPLDLFWIDNKIFSCKGMFNYGKQVSFLLLTKIKYIYFSKITKIYKFGSLVYN